MRISDWSSDVCSSDLEGFVEGGFADLEARGGLANCEAGSDMFARLAELVRCDHWPPPTGATSLASGLEACMGALPDQIALKLGKRAEDVEHQHPARSGGVDVLGERSEENTAELHSLMRISYA